MWVACMSSSRRFAFTAIRNLTSTWKCTLLILRSENFKYHSQYYNAFEISESVYNTFYGLHTILAFCYRSTLKQRSTHIV